MNPEQLQQFQETIIKQIAGYTASHSSLMMALKEDTKEIKDHLKELNGSVASTKERVTILETEFKPIKAIVNKVIWSIVASFLAAIGYVVYKK